MERNGSSLSAGLLAILVILVMLTSSAALMLTMDRQRVNNNLDAATVAQDLESSSADSSDAKAADESSEEELNVDFVEYPAKAENYQEFENNKFTASNAILVDVDNNTIVAGKNYDKTIYPASLTKIMTLLVAAENVTDLNDTYTFTADDIDPLVEENASTAGFSAGETVTVKDLMFASELVSGADGTLGLSKAIAGSEKDFVTMMNDKAAEMGLKHTHFTNTSGLHNKYHYSTAEDIAVILKTAMENEMCKNVLTSKAYRTSKTAQHENGIVLRSIVFDRIVDYYVENGGEITGGKTGFTDESKFSFATTYENKGRNFICVTSGSTGEYISVEDTIMLYEKFAADNTITDVSAADASTTETAE